jgi:hypothetical protein
LPVGLVPPTGVAAVANGNLYLGCGASASATIRPSATGAAIGSSSQGSNFLTEPCSSLSGNGYVRARTTFSAAAPTTGTLKISVSATSGGSNASGRIEFDVGDDGSFEISRTNGAFVLTVDVAFGPRPLSVLVRADASANASWTSFLINSASAGATLTFTAGSSVVGTSGPPCGPALGTYTFVDGNRTLVLRASGSLVVPDAFLVAGVTPLSIPLPHLGCLLGTDLALVLQTPVLADGSVRVPIVLPAALHGSFLAQFLVGVVDPVLGEVWRTSNTLGFGF